ncbi:MAG: cell division protein ZapA [Kosmotogaceae bacterium]
MRRYVKLKLGDKEFEFLTTDPDEFVDKVFGEIQREYELLEKNSTNVGFEKIITGILVNKVGELIKTESELQRLKEKYNDVLSELNRGRGKIGKKKDRDL